MPNYRGHLVGGFFAFALLNYIKYFKGAFTLNFLILFSNLVLCLLGSLLPDIDIHSKGRRIYDHFILFTLLACFLFRFSRVYFFLAGCFIFARIVGHRTLTHNPLFVLIAPFCLMGFLCHNFNVVFCLDRDAYYAFVAGALSHLVLDAIPKRYLPSYFYL